MFQRIIQVISDEIAALFELKKTERLWHIPVLASLCVGVPLLVGYFLDRLDVGLLSCLGGLVILYMPSTSVANRMITLLACSFGFLVAYTIGIVFSFHPVVSAISLGLFAFAAHWVTNYLQIRPPGNFFFIMLASVSACAPFDLATVPTRIGLIAMSTMFATGLALVYSLFIVSKYPPKEQVTKPLKHQFDRIFESAIVGVFIGGSMLVAKLLELNNPYWIPISCLAVMQGVSTRHIFQRSFQRILGTSIGMLLAWVLLSFNPGPLGFVMGILMLQFIVEMLIVRHYALAVVFITPMTLFLAEAASNSILTVNELIATRFLDIVIGSVIGAIGGWFLYHQKLNQQTKKSIRLTQKVLHRTR